MHKNVWCILTIWEISESSSYIPCNRYILKPDACSTSQITRFLFAKTNLPSLSQTLSLKEELTRSQLRRTSSIAETVVEYFFLLRYPIYPYTQEDNIVGPSTVPCVIAWAALCITVGHDTLLTWITVSSAYYTFTLFRWYINSKEKDLALWDTILKLKLLFFLE